MNAVFSRLKSMLPPQAATTDAVFLSAPKALRAWLDDVPLANRGFALMRMHEMLLDLNATPIAASQRLPMLGMFEDATAALVDDVRNEAREFFPMSAERIEDARLGGEIERELALGYVAAACDLCAPAGGVPFLRRGAVAEALARAAQHQSTRLWLACRTHREPDGGVWQGLHDVFRFAVECGCADKAKAAAADGSKASVRSIYAEALLYAFARPNQFTQQQNRQLHTSLPVLASWCDVRPGHAPPGTIAICSTGDASPPSPPRGGQVDAGDRWLLDVGPLLAQFDALLAARGEAAELHLPARRGGGRATLSVDTIGVLRRVWSERTERESARNPDGGVFETEVGLAGLHDLLMGERDFESAFPLVGEAARPVASWATRVPGRMLAKRARARAIDRSRHGYRLQWEAGEDARARVGELIAFSPAGRTGGRQWRYGALRWLRADSKAGIDAGVELLPSTPVAVAVYAVDAGGSALPPVRGILIEPRAAGAEHGDEAGIWVLRPFAAGAITLEVVCFNADAEEPASRSVRVMKFAVRDAGLYQKIVLPDEALASIAQPALGAAATQA